MVIEEIIKKYLDKTVTKSELELLQHHLKEHDLSILKDIMHKEWLRDELLDHDITPELSTKILKEIQSQTRSPKRLPRHYGIAAAATVLLVASMTWFLARPDGNWQIVETAYGEWRSIELPDGSVVKLNAHSLLKYRQNSSFVQSREVHLEGEAFFDVSKMDNAPFSVVTKDLEIEVLGTAFNVNSRGEATEVFLEHGGVKLDLGTEIELLEPGDFLSYSSKNQLLVKKLREVPADEHTSWKDGVKIMKDATVDEILGEIEDIYGLDIVITRKNLLSKIKTVAVPMDKLEVTIPILEKTLNSQVTRKGDKLIIH